MPESETHTLLPADLPAQQTPPLLPTFTGIIRLGTHLLELLEDGGILLVDTTGRETVQLDQQETYRLLSTLHAHAFPQVE